MIRLITVVLMVLLIFDTQAVTSPIPGEFIVVLNSPSEQALYESTAPLPYSSSFTIGKTFQAYHYKNVNASTLVVLRNHPNVDYVEGNGRVHITDVQKSPPSWGLKRVSKRNLPLEDQYLYPSSAGKGVRAYIIDTGIYREHKDFGGRAVMGVTINKDGGDTDCNGHGTHVAGTVAGTQYGIAKLATPIHVKVLDCKGSGSMSDVLGGIEWAVKDNAGKDKKTGVINLSLGGDASQAMNDAINAAFENGLFSAVAAGNDKYGDACTKSPASAEHAWTTAAADTNDKPASFTNLGKCVNGWAPGVGITSCYIGSDTATKTMSGTSMASPHVAGVAVLLLGKTESGMSPSELFAKLTGLTTPDVIDYGLKEETYANESLSSFFEGCKKDSDCPTARKCCPDSGPSGQCVSSGRTCCGDVSGGCGPTTTCCPGKGGKGAHCASMNQVCCGDTVCSKSQTCCDHDKGNFCCGKGEVCEPDRTCSNPFLEQTPNKNLFNGGE